MKTRNKDKFDDLLDTMKEAVIRAGHDPMWPGVWYISGHDEDFLRRANVEFPTHAVVEGKPAKKEWTVELLPHEIMAIHGLLHFVAGYAPSVTAAYPGMADSEDDASWGTDDGSVEWAKQMVAEVEHRLVKRFPKVGVHIWRK